MSAAIRQREAKQKRLDSEDAPELRNDRDAASLTDERGILTERLAQRALRSLPDFRMRISHIPRPAVTPRNLHRHPRRQVLFEMPRHQVQDLVALLIRHEPECELRHRVTPNHSFGSHALVTATDAVDFRGRTAPESF